MSDPIQPIRQAVTVAAIASCDCNCKSPDPAMHHGYCRYLKLMAILDACDDAADRIDALEAEVARWQELQKSIATIANFGDNWPSHGNAPLAIAASYALLRKRAEKAEAEVAKLRAIKPLSASDLANAIGCFWNAAIGAAHERQSVGAMDTACIMAAGVAAIEQRLLEVSALTAPADPQPPEKDDCDWTYQNACEDFPEETAAPADPQPVAQERLWCSACRDVGIFHCAHPDECGHMLPIRFAADSWKSWLDDLPVDRDFQPGLDRLQDFITALSADPQPSEWNEAIRAAALTCDTFDGPASDSDWVNGQATAAQQIRGAILALLRPEGGE